jgi:hypothetical protein
VDGALDRNEIVPFVLLESELRNVEHQGGHHLGG